MNRTLLVATALICLLFVGFARAQGADLDDVPEAVRSTMEFIAVDTVDEVFDAALGISTETSANDVEAIADVQ